MGNYSDERSIQILIHLLKAHGINQVIASPGATNISLVASLQSDPYFKIYSCVDERSAAYMACGLAAESSTPVMLSCTGATSSRNYLPGLTEAYYRKLPILVVTSTRELSQVGHLVPQQLDRSQPPKDSVLLSLHVQVVKDNEDEWDVGVKVNKAILELIRRGGGPVHINLSTTASMTYGVREISPVKVIRRYTRNSSALPNLPAGRIGIFIGAHRKFTDNETSAIERFCEKNNAVVFCDHTSGYYGKYKINASLALAQLHYRPLFSKLDLMIHIGEVSGDYAMSSIKPNQVWRVSEDGEIRDRFRKLTWVFELSEREFFEMYCRVSSNSTEFYDLCHEETEYFNQNIPELPLSNAYAASVLSPKIPENSVLHLGILNSLRHWNMFKFANNVETYCNTGGFGIDGIISTAIGASLFENDRLYYVVLGDLAFFYDLNSLGNRHVGNNLRVLLINNGRGMEFRNFNHAGAKLDVDSNEYVAAAGHFGNQSDSLVKEFANSLGYAYISAASKHEFDIAAEKFVDASDMSKPIIFEVFTTEDDENAALKALMTIKQDPQSVVKSSVKNLLGDKGIATIKRILK